MRRAYDPRISVTAGWALEFQPVCVAVVYVQLEGNEAFCIGSRQWFFEELATCVAEAREVFPWRASEHVLPPEKSRLWAETFETLGLANVSHAPELGDSQRMLTTQQFLRRLHIDTAPRGFALEGNNADLVDALNGYRVKELSGQADTFTLNLLASSEQYLSRALEHLATWERSAVPLSDWSKPQNYAAQDRAVV